MEATKTKVRMAVSFLVGGLLGAGIAILLAPQSGRRTRRDLRYFGKKMVNKTEAAGLNVRRSIDKLMDDVSEGLHDGMKIGREWTGRAGKEVREAAVSAGEQLKEGIKNIGRVS